MVVGGEPTSLLVLDPLVLVADLCGAAKKWNITEADLSAVADAAFAGNNPLPSRR